jgi:hypothetical protein
MTNYQLFLDSLLESIHPARDLVKSQHLLIGFNISGN